MVNLVGEARAIPKQAQGVAEYHVGQHSPTCVERNVRVAIWREHGEIERIPQGCLRDLLGIVHLGNARQNVDFAAAKSG